MFLQSRCKQMASLDISRVRSIEYEGSCVLDLFKCDEELQKFKSEADDLPASAARKEGDKLLGGLVSCVYMFRGGKNETNVSYKWLNGKSWESVYTLMMWSYSIYLVLKGCKTFENSSPILASRVGFLFCGSEGDSVHTLAMLSNLTFFLNPEKIKLPVVSNDLRPFTSVLLSLAAHECVHLDIHDHDEQFSSVLTCAMEQVLKGNLVVRLEKAEPNIRKVAKDLVSPKKRKVVD